MKYLILDNEGTSFSHASGPFDPKWKLCIVSYATPDESGFFKIDYDGEPYGAALQGLQRMVDEADLIVNFNLKFDLHGLRRYGIKFDGKKVWCCQLVEYMLSRQQLAMPSLDEVLAKHDLGAKYGAVVHDAWARGIDTPDIPLSDLSEYGVIDAERTRALFLHQYEVVSNRSLAFRNLVKLHCDDLLVLEEMEWNGSLIDVDECNRLAEVARREIAECETKLAEQIGADWINWDSPKQVSSILFGGKITKTVREQVGIYKTGQKIGQPRFAIREEVHEFPRMVKPAKGSELKGGGWSTSEDHLRSILPRGGAGRAFLDVLLHRAKLEKLAGTYYEGLPKTISSMGWQEGFLHGTLNQCIARTGRLASSKPNMQNLPPEIDKLFRSRWGSDGRVVSFDVKGLEWVAIAYLAQDPVAMQEIWDKIDQHEMNKERFGLPEKRVAKYFVFRLLFGGVAKTFTKDPDFSWVSKDEEFWQEIVEKFYEKYAAIGKTHEAWYRNAIENGLFTSPTGREFLFFNEAGEDWKWIRPVILNYPVQSLGADLVAIARVSLYKRMKRAGLKSKLINTIHDSIIVDILNEEWYTVNKMVNEVFDDLPLNFERLFGKAFNLPMRVEAKALNGEEV